MNQKKSDGKAQARTRLTLAARMLSGAVRAALPAPPREEPWRNRKSNGKNSFKR